MHTGCQYYSFSNSDLLLSTLEVRYDDHFNIIASNSLCQDSLPDPIFVFIGTDPSQESAAIAVSVRVTMRNIYFVIIIGKRHLELQRVIVSTAIPFHCVLEVCDVFTISVPAYPTWPCCFFD